MNRVGGFVITMIRHYDDQCDLSPSLVSESPSRYLGVLNAMKNNRAKLKGSHVRSCEWSSATASSLLARAIADDPQAWDALLEKYGPRVYHWIRLKGIKSHDTQDISQAVFAVVALKLNTLQRDQEGNTFRGWLRRITQNKINDWYRSQSKHPEPVGGTDHQGLVDKLTDEKNDQPNANAEMQLPEECEEAVRLVRSRCREQTWEMFWQVCVEDRQPADVAADFGVPVGVVYVAKTRVTRRLKEASERLR